MAVESLLGRLRDAGTAHVGELLDRTLLEAAAPARLPDDYVETLAQLNGFSVHSGTNRLFGVRSDPNMDMRSWNEEGRWRFAWGARVAPFFCIGETAFGDQYALMLTDDGAVFRPQVYLLEANFLQPEVIAEGFSQFLEQDLVRNAEDPWDEIAVEAVERYGPIDVASNWVYTPSIALGGPEDLANLVELDCFTAMTIAGDIVAAIDGAPDEA